MEKSVIDTLFVTTKEFFLVTQFGAIQLNSIRTTVGHRASDVKLHSPDCADRHASIIVRPDGAVKIFNRAESADHYIYIDDIKLLPGDFMYLKTDNVISFSGVETFKFVDSVPTVVITEPLHFSPD